MSQKYFEESALKDPTWKRALGLSQEVQSTLHSQVWSLVRSSWVGSMSSQEMIRALGFARLNPWWLIRATDFGAGVGFPDAEAVSHAIESLGVQQSAVVLTVGHFCQLVAERKPPRGWRALFESVAAAVNTGRVFGSRVLSIGAGGGGLMGFARYVPNLVLLAHDPESAESCVTAEQKLDSERVLSKFGCEPYQIAAMTLQQLGYGPHTSLGVALAHGKLNPVHIELGDEVKHWEAAYLWCEALIDGRNYPARPEVRTFFSEVAPPPAGSRNQLLETLYTEVARVRSKRAEITWHLPKMTYDDTARAYDLKLS